jgi:TPR repeat protein
MAARPAVEADSAKPVPLKDANLETVAKTQPTPADKHSITLASDTERAIAPDNGTQELMLAQRYLDQNEPSVASRWLWKAVSKKNGRAAMLLADLYARGDGVSKSCDQARVLLMAAAKKGAVGAGERLQSLESGSCR